MENQGQIPVECQAVRTAQGLEAQETHLEEIIDPMKVSLKFFLPGTGRGAAELDQRSRLQDVTRSKGNSHVCTRWAGEEGKSQPQVVAEHLCSLAYGQLAVLVKSRCN